MFLYNKFGYAAKPFLRIWNVRAPEISRGMLLGICATRYAGRDPSQDPILVSGMAVMI